MERTGLFQLAVWAVCKMAQTDAMISMWLPRQETCPLIVRQSKVDYGLWGWMAGHIAGGSQAPLQFSTSFASWGGEYSWKWPLSLVLNLLGNCQWLICQSRLTGCWPGLDIIYILVVNSMPKTKVAIKNQCIIWKRTCAHGKVCLPTWSLLYLTFLHFWEPPEAFMYMRDY